MIKPGSIQTVLNSARHLLADSDTARLDAELLLQSVLDCERSYFFSHPEKTIDETCIDQFSNLLDQRIKGKPIAHLLGEREFWSIKLKVTEDTLIPRPETELLVEQALKVLPEEKQIKVLDMGTGTGAIALSIAKERTHAEVLATDISTKALEVAKSNAKRNAINNVHFIESNWFSNLDAQHFDLIVSNPPYIAVSDPHLQQGDVRFEPKQALVSGEDGMDDIKKIIREAVYYLKQDGYLLLEHGYQQGEYVKQLLETRHYKEIQSLYDLAEHHRATMAQKGTNKEETA